MSEEHSSEPPKQSEIFYTGVPDRRCEKCGKLKPLEEFRMCMAKGKRCRRYTCFGCERGYKKVRARTPRGADSRKRRNGHDKGYVLKKFQYSEMLREQKGVCCLCGQPESRIDKNTGEPYRLSVEHDHETGKIRGLSCAECNQLLAFVERSLKKHYGDPTCFHELTARMVSYLARHAPELPQ